MPDDQLPWSRPIDCIYEDPLLPSHAGRPTRDAITVKSLVQDHWSNHINARFAVQIILLPSAVNASTAHCSL